MPLPPINATSTSSGQTAREHWQRFALGPALTRKLGWTPGHLPFSDDSVSSFTDFLGREGQSGALATVADEQELIELLDELVAMQLPQAALQLFSRHKALWSGQDFRGELALGAAAMLAGDFTMALHRFESAHALMPQEPAPIVNLTQILTSQREFARAGRWARAGLAIERNHLALWDLLAQTLPPPDVVTSVAALAAELDSWAGRLLVAHLKKSSPQQRLAILAASDSSTDPDANHLIQYTAVLGELGHYRELIDKIQQLTWLGSENLPWQVRMHAGQAHLALSEDEQAAWQFQQALNDPMIPAAATETMTTILRELQRENDTGVGPD